MKNLLQFEFRRLLKAKYFYICIAVSVALLLISAATTKILMQAVTINEEEMPDIATAAFMAPTALSLMKQIGSSSVTMILAIFTTLFVTEDYTSDTIKNVYSRGYTSSSVFFAKYIVTFVAGAIFLALTSLASFLIGLSFDGVGKAGTNYAGAYLTILFCLIAYITIYFAIAISIRKTGGSIALSIIGPLALSLILYLFNAILKLDNVDLSDYWLDGRMTILQTQDVEGREIGIGCLIAFLLTAAGGVAGYFINLKREQ